MTLCSASIEYSRTLWARQQAENLAAFDAFPVGAVFDCVRRRTLFTEARLTKVGANTVSDVGTMRTVAESPIACGGVRLVLVEAPEDPERWDGQA